MGRPWRGWVPTTPSTSTVSVTTPSTLPGFRCHCRSISGPRPWNSCRASSPTVCELVEGIVTVLQSDFIKILSQIRLGEGIPEAVTLLNKRCVRPHRTAAQPLLLTPTKAAAERYNHSGLNTLSSDPVIFSAEIVGRLEIDRDRLPIPEHLELRVGARVMAVKNDPEGRWCNGSLGTVKRIEDSDVFVRFDRSGDEHVVSGAEWMKVRQ